jgi:hypothetical protein
MTFSVAKNNYYLFIFDDLNLDICGIMLHTHTDCNTKLGYADKA